MLVRFIIYGCLGLCLEVAWTALASTFAREQKGWRLAGTTYLWMFPIYGLIAVLYEPAYFVMRDLPWPIRAAVYATGFMIVEYITGWVLRRYTGTCPWDYTGRARWHVDGLVRVEYAPLWAILGLALEPVVDFLVRVTPTLYAALGR